MCRTRHTSPKQPTNTAETYHCSWSSDLGGHKAPERASDECSAHWASENSKVDDGFYRDLPLSGHVRELASEREPRLVSSAAR